MQYQLLQDLATLHARELRRARAQLRWAPVQHRGLQHRLPSLRVRAGWTLVTIGLSLAAGPPATPRPDAG